MTDTFLIKVHNILFNHLSHTIKKKQKPQKQHREMYASFDHLSGLIVGECSHDPNVSIIIVPDNIEHNQDLLWQKRNSVDRSQKYTGTAVGEIRYAHGTSEYKITFYPDATDDYKNYVSNVVSAMTQQQQQYQARG